MRGESNEMGEGGRREKKVSGEEKRKEEKQAVKQETR